MSANILPTSLDRNVEGTVEAVAEAYDTGLRRIVDHHAPLHETYDYHNETIVTMPWYTDELRHEKHDRRRYIYVPNNVCYMYYLNETETLYNIKAYALNRIRLH